MSWFGGYKPSNSKKSTESNVDSREARRQKLDAERIARKQQREDRQRQLQITAQAQEEADKALQDLLNIDPDILVDTEASDIPEEEVQRIFEEDTMADFDKENGTDGDKALEKMGNLVCPFSLEDLDFWFSELEGQLEMIEVKSLWSKRMALQRLLPMEVKEEVKTLLRLSKTQAGNDIYFRIKEELMDLFGKKTRRRLCEG